MASVPQRRPYHVGDLGPRLIEMATAMVRAGEEPSVRALASAVGVDPAAVYRHFKDKAELLRAVAAVGHDALGLAMETRLAQAVGPAERFMAIGEAYVRFALDEPTLFRVMFGPATVVDSAEPTRAALLLHQTLSELQPTLPPGAAVSAWALVHGLSVLFLDRRVRYDVDETIAAVMERALQMVSVPVASQRRDERAQGGDFVEPADSQSQET